MDAYLIRNPRGACCPLSLLVTVKDEPTPEDLDLLRSIDTGIEADHGGHCLEHYVRQDAVPAVQEALSRGLPARMKVQQILALFGAPLRCRSYAVRHAWVTVWHLRHPLVSGGAQGGQRQPRWPQHDTAASGPAPWTRHVHPQHRWSP